MQGKSKKSLTSLGGIFTTFVVGLLLNGHSIAQQAAMMNPGLVGRDQTEAIQINEAIFQATGFGNTTMVVTSDGNVIIDTSLIVNAPRHKRLLQARTMAL
jgi:hypothetical protein